MVGLHTDNKVAEFHTDNKVVGLHTDNKQNGGIQSSNIKTRGNYSSWHWMERNFGRSDMVNTKMVGLHTDNKQNDGALYSQQTLK